MIRPAAISRVDWTKVSVATDGDCSKLLHRLLSTDHLRTGSPLLVRIKNVIFRLHDRMARIPAIDGALRAARFVIDVGGVGGERSNGGCPSLDGRCRRAVSPPSCSHASR